MIRVGVEGGIGGHLQALEVFVEEIITGKSEHVLSECSTGEALAMIMTLP